MPRPPPRPLCLPELVSNPQTRADFVLANPPRYGPSSTRSSTYSDSSYARVPPSPTSTNDADSHRASGATFASLNFPATPASSRTSLSVHNLSWNGDTANSFGLGSEMPSTQENSSGGKSWNFGRLSLGGATSVVSQKQRTSWSSAFVNTRSWFGNTAAAEPAKAIASASSQREIKLSPSMIAASASTQSVSNRSVYSSFPPTSDEPILLPTRNVDTSRSPKVGTGLRYYTERDPAPEKARVQISDPIDLQDHDRPQSPLPPSHHGACAPTSTVSFSSFSTPVKELPSVPDETVPVLSATLHQAALKDTAMLRYGDVGPLSPPPTPPVHERENNVPRIRVSFGEDS